MDSSQCDWEHAKLSPRFMKSIRFAIAKNAFANVIRGGASAVVAIVLPHFLTRSLGPDRFAGWALMLQLAGYANYLDFGLQTAVARYMAGALEKGDKEACDRLLSTAISILTVAGAIAVLGLGVIAWQVPHLFNTVSPNLAGEIGLGVAILGISAAIGLPLSAYSGVLIGLQRNEFPAIAIASSRILGAVAVLLVVRHTQSLVWLSCCVAGFNLLAAFAQYAIAKKLLPWLRFKIVSVERAMTTELIRYCSTLSIWSFSMLLVSGLDVTIVGLFKFSAAGAYSIATTLVMFFTGLISAAFSAMLAPIAALQARQDYSRISRLILTTTRINSYLSIGAIVITFLFGETLIRAWVGPSYLAITFPVLKILLIAQTIRLVGNAYGTALISLGLQRYGLLPALLEGSLNLVLSIVGMVFLGPLGVAWATLIAAAIAISVTVFFVVPRVEVLSIRRSKFIFEGVLVPTLPFLPICIWLVARDWYVRVFPASGVHANWLAVLLMLVTMVLVGRDVAALHRSNS
jgi:O-antigen/teichoic acid export membrane protein